MRDNKHYYAARAVDERRLAMASVDAKARAIHLEMAARYADLSNNDGPVEPAEEQRA